MMDGTAGWINSRWSGHFTGNWSQLRNFLEAKDELPQAEIPFDAKTKNEGNYGKLWDHDDYILSSKI